jgi:hypothetical protein
MSVQAMKWAFSQTIVSEGPFTVLMALAWIADAKGNGEMKVDDVAFLAKMTRRSTQRHLSVLAGKGILSHSPQHGRGRSTPFHLDLSATENVTENVTEATRFSEENVRPVSSFPQENVRPVSSFPQENVRPVSSFPQENVRPVSSFPQENVRPVSRFSAENVRPVSRFSAENVTENVTENATEATPFTAPSLTQNTKDKREDSSVPSESSVTAEKSTRKRDPLWDAFEEEVGFRPETESERMVWNTSLRSLRKAHATPEQMHERCAEYRARFPGAELTLPALLRHWGRLGVPRPDHPARASPTGQYLNTQQQTQNAIGRYAARIEANGTQNDEPGSTRRARLTDRGVPLDDGRPRNGGVGPLPRGHPV